MHVIIKPKDSTITSKYNQDKKQCFQPLKHAQCILMLLGTVVFSITEAFYSAVLDGNELSVLTILKICAALYFSTLTMAFYYARDKMQRNFDQLKLQILILLIMSLTSVIFIEIYQKQNNQQENDQIQAMLFLLLIVQSLVPYLLIAKQKITFCICFYLYILVRCVILIAINQKVYSSKEIIQLAVVITVQALSILLQKDQTDLYGDNSYIINQKTNNNVDENSENLNRIGLHRKLTLNKKNQPKSSSLQSQLQTNFISQQKEQFQKDFKQQEQHQVIKYQADNSLLNLTEQQQMLNNSEGAEKFSFQDASKDHNPGPINFAQIFQLSPRLQLAPDSILDRESSLGHQQSVYAGPSVFTFQKQISPVREALTTAASNNLSVQLLQSALDTTGQGIAIISEHKQILYQNKRLKQFVKTLNGCQLIDYLFQQPDEERKRSLSSIDKLGVALDEDSNKIEKNQEYPSKSSSENEFYQSQRQVSNLSAYNSNNKTVRRRNNSLPGQKPVALQQQLLDVPFLRLRQQTLGDTCQKQLDNRQKIIELNSSKPGTQLSDLKQKPVFRFTFEQFLESKIKQFGEKQKSDNVQSSEGNVPFDKKWRTAVRSKTVRAHLEARSTIINKQPLSAAQQIQQQEESVSELDDVQSVIHEYDNKQKSAQRNSTSMKRICFRVRLHKLFEQFVLVIVLSEQNQTASVSVNQDELTIATQELKRKLVHSSCHELRTPLNFTLNTLSHLADDEDIALEMRQNYIEPALCSSEIMLNVIKNLEDYYALDSGKFRLNFFNFNLEQLIKHCISLVSSQAAAKNLQITITYDRQISEAFYNDPDRIKQVLLTLLCNSVKLTHKGYINVDASLIDEVNGQVAITVSDTGTGLSKQITDALKKNWKQLDTFSNIQMDHSANDSSYNGSMQQSFPDNDLSQKSKGERDVTLGLQIISSIVKGMTSAQKYQIEVENMHGQGSQLRFFVQNWEKKYKGVQFKKFRLQEGEWEHYEVPFLNDSLSSWSKSVDTLRQLDSQHKCSSHIASSNDSSSQFQQKRQQNRRSKQTKNDSAGVLEDRLHQHSRHKVQRYSPHTRMPLFYASVVEKKNESTQSPRQKDKTDDQNNQQPKYKTSSFLTNQVAPDNIPDSQQNEDISDSSDAEQHAQSVRADVQEVVVVGKINLKTCDCADILCVDDDPFNLRVLTQTLTKLKFVCHEAHDGEEAVQKVLEYFNSDKDVSHTCNCKTYGLIFMDIDMPRKNGFQASQEITQFGKRIVGPWKTVICAHSAFLDNESEKKARRSGMTLVLPKPSNIEKLESVLQKVFPMYQYR